MGLGKGRSVRDRSLVENMKETEKQRNEREGVERTEGT